MNSSQEPMELANDDNLDTIEIKKIFFTIDQLELILTKSGNGTNRLPVYFDNWISKKIQQDLNGKCWLRSRYNHIRKINSRKKASNFFIGRYYCLNSCNNCSVIYDVSLKSKSDVFFNIIQSSTAQHEVLLQPSHTKRITADSRRKIAIELKANGVSNFQDNIFLMDKIYRKSKYNFMLFLISCLVNNIGLQKVHKIHF